jgi:hypothetical protein
MTLKPKPEPRPEPRPEPKADDKPSDEDVLNDALSGKKVEDEPKESEGPPGDEKSEETPESDEVKDTGKKVKQYKTYGEALAATLHWEKVAGKNADTVKERDRTIDALNARLAQLEKALNEKLKPEAKNEEDNENPLLDMLDKRVEAKLQERLRLLQDQHARREAQAYKSKMMEKWGDAWDGMQSDRDSMVADWKRGKLLEPELWQYAVVGRMFLDRQITTDDLPRDESRPGATDKRSAAKRPDEIERPGSKSDEDILGDALGTLMKRPMGTAPVR